MTRIQQAQLRLARAYAYVDDQVASDDRHQAEQAAAVALELYAAAAHLASESGHVELIPDRPCVNDTDAADQLRQALLELEDAGASPLQAAARHLTDAHRRLTGEEARS